MATLDQKKLWLADAEQRYHELATGQAASVFVDQNGERIEYNKSDMLRLKAYIKELSLEVNGGKVGGPYSSWM